MAAPTRVQSVAVAYGIQATAGTASSTFNVLTGDLLVVRAMSEDSAATLTISDNSAGALTWTLRQSDVTASHCAAYVWTAPIPAGRTGLTVTLTTGTTNTVYGFRVTTWRNHGGVGVSNKATGTTAPSVTLTGVSANSAIDAEVTDWNAGAASGTWGTGPGAVTSETATQVPTRASFYEAYYADTGTAGSKTVSMASVPAGAVTQILALEILAAAGGGGAAVQQTLSLMGVGS